MNRIENIHSINISKLSLAPSKREAISNQEFVKKFQNIKSEQVRSHLENLFNEITIQSEKITEKTHISEVIRYKNLVREFLDVAVKNSHQFSKQNFLDRRGRHRVYCIVKSVDHELESLTKEFLTKEVDHLAVVKKLDDIRGLLLDVFM